MILLEGWNVVKLEGFKVVKVVENMAKKLSFFLDVPLLGYSTFGTP
jgi:hypothetical protein